jgi:hypothetical protein
MATRIESGQMQLRGVGGVPMQQVTPREVDYVGFRAEAQAANTLSQLVDRMSQTAFQMAGEAAQRRATFDVATNPLSAEQLNAAKNGDTSFMGRGSQFNIYDVTMRKARAFELSAAFETEAKAEVVKILADVENGQMDSQNAAQKLNNVTNGFARSLANVDADAALKFTASMGVYSNTVMAEAYKQEQKRTREKKTLLLNSDFNDTMKLVEPAIKQGFFVDANGQEQPIELVLDVYRKNLTDHAFSVGGLQLSLQYQADFDKRVSAAKINAATTVALGDEYMADPVIGLSMLREGNLGRMSGVFSAMPQDDKDRVIANYMTAVGQRETARKNTEDTEKRAAVAQFVPMFNEAMRLPEGSPRRRQLTAQIASISEAHPTAVPLSILADLQKPQGDGNPMVEFNVMTGIYNGTISSPEQINAVTGLTGTQKVRLLGKLVSEDRRTQSQLDKDISRLAGIPTVPGQVVVIDPKGVEWERRNQLVNMADEFRASNALQGKVVTNQDIVEYLEQQLSSRRNTEQANAARRSLESYAKKDWIGGEITRDSLSALERKAGNNQTRQRELVQIRKLLDQAEGN